VYAKPCAPPRAKDPCARNDAPVCPDCGELKCLCRPRFFAGQLLTEQDLNRLDQYIKDKNRLHNRYLHGWGVVCGLEVGCDACDTGNVLVSPGYALSPCGDDIIVCKQDTVDVCELIKCCRQQEPKDCRPYGERRDCKDAEEQWVLAVSYLESPSRGITALRGGSCSKCGSSPCTCKGSNGNANGNGSGCGCGGQEPVRSRPRAAPAACEPTIVCEGYRYEVFRLPKTDASPNDPRGYRPSQDKGDMYNRMMCCIQPLLDLFEEGTAAMKEAQSQQAKYQVCCRIKRDLRELIAGMSIRHCEILRQLDYIVCPDPNMPNDQFDQAMDKVGDQVLLILWQVAVECMCRAMLPPCPDPDQDPRVPLAVVTVSGGSCRVLQVCNWTVLRKFVTTFPNLQYWLSWLPYGRMLRQLIEALCCNLGGLDKDLQQESHAASGALGAVQPTTDSAPPMKEASLGDTIVQPQLKARHSANSAAISEAAFKAYQRSADDLTLRKVLGGLSGTEPESGLSEAERSNPAPFLMLNMLAKPMLSGSLPGLGALTGAHGGLSDEFVKAALSPLLGGMAEREASGVEAELETMREQLRRQDQAIKALQDELARR
jgi:hypothetical protein